jgi:hypothetical protein
MIDLTTRSGIKCGLGTPHRHQPLFWLLEFLRSLGDGLCFGGGVHIAQPNSLGAEDQDRPPNGHLSCHKGGAYCIGAVPSMQASGPNVGPKRAGTGPNEVKRDQTPSAESADIMGTSGTRSHHPEWPSSFKYYGASGNVPQYGYTEE